MIAANNVWPWRFCGNGGDGRYTALIGVLLFVLILTLLMVPLGMASWFAAALVLFNDMLAWNAFKAEFQRCLRNIMPFFVYSLIAMVLVRAGAASAGAWPDRDAAADDGDRLYQLSRRIRRLRRYDDAHVLANCCGRRSNADAQAAPFSQWLAGNVARGQRRVDQRQNTGCAMK